MRSLALVVLAPLAVLATPYGPGDDRALLPPPAGRSAVRGTGDRVAVAGARHQHRCSSTCSRRSRSLLVWVGSRRLTVFDIAVLALTLVGRRSPRSGESRGSRSPAWCSFPSRSVAGSRASAPGEPRRGLNIASSASGSSVAIVAVARPRSSSAATRGSRTTGRREPVRGRPRRAAARRPGLRPRSLLRLAALQDPGAPRAHRVRRALRDLRRERSSTACRTTTGSRARLEVVRGRLPDRRRRRDESVAHGRLPEGARARASSTATTSSRSSPDRES